MSMLDMGEAELVTIAEEVGLMGSIGELGLVIISRPAVAGAEDTKEAETDSLTGSC